MFKKQQRFIFVRYQGVCWSGIDFSLRFEMTEL